MCQMKQTQPQSDHSDHKLTHSITVFAKHLWQPNEDVTQQSDHLQRGATCVQMCMELVTF